MRSKYLSNLTEQQKNVLRKKLWKIQEHKCFICEKEINLTIHQDLIDIDHIKPLILGGKDEENNFALTHSSCNRSKQASHLRIARILAKFNEISNKTLKEKKRAPNLDDIFEIFGGSRYSFNFEIENNFIKYSFSEMGDETIYQSQIYIDKLSGSKYFFALFPIQYLFHDDRINPRSIGRNISKLIQEFFIKRPQLHISLGYIKTKISPTKVKIFDGQHKAAAQVFLNIKELPTRVFIEPDLDILLTTNTNAGTTLRQVAFDKSVQRHLGCALYSERVRKYQKEHNLPLDNFDFSEDTLIKYFKGESREMKRYITDSVRNNITHNEENKLKDFIDFSGRTKDKPLSYSTIEKTFYSFFISKNVLKVFLNYRIDEGMYPRDLEKEQIVKLMNIIAEEIYIGKFDPDEKLFRIEHRLQKGELIPEDNLIAFRMSKEEIVYNWLKYIKDIIYGYFTLQGEHIDLENLFQYKFPDPLFDKIRNFIRNLRNLPIWVNKELSRTVFGGKQNYDYWKHIFNTGKTVDNVQILAEPIKLMEMISED